MYEEEYLVNSVARLVERVNAVGEEVSRLIVGLMRRGMREQSRAVENAMVELVELCRSCVGEVFDRSGSDDVAAALLPSDGQREAVERPKGGDGVLWDSMEEEMKQKEAPVVKGFDKLSLLTRC